MELIFKIVLIGIITCIATLIVRPIKNDFAIIIGIAGGLILLLLIINYFTGVMISIKEIIGYTGLNSNLYTLLLKIIGVGYLVEFTAGICSEIVIMVMALPIITNILSIITEILPT